MNPEEKAQQLAWLEMTKNHIATSLRIETDDFENISFQTEGGTFKMYEVFDDALDTILEMLNEGVAA